MTGFADFSSAARPGLVNKDSGFNAQTGKIKNATGAKAFGGFIFGASWWGEHLECSPCGE
jgi:hypothetical protein